MINEQVFKRSAYPISRTLQLEENMFSLVYISTLRPEYKLYCDLVHKTKQTHPLEDDGAIPKENRAPEEGEKERISWYMKAKAFLCCKTAETGKLIDETNLQMNDETERPGSDTAENSVNNEPSPIKVIKEGGIKVVN